MTDNRKIISLGGDDNIMELGIGMVTQLYEYTRNCWIIYLKKRQIVWYVNYTSTKLLLLKSVFDYI